MLLVSKTWILINFHAISSITQEQADTILQQLGLVKVFITGNQVISSESLYQAGGAIGSNGNVYIGTGTQDPVSIDLEGKKNVDGKPATGSDYTFVLKDQNGNILQTVSNVDGSFTFDPIIFLPENAQPGDVFTFTVSEVVGSITGIKYDSTIYTITVTIGSKSHTQGQDVFEWLTADVVITKDGKSVEEIVFNNEHEDPEEPKEPGKPKSDVPTSTETNWMVWSIVSVLSLAGFILLSKKQNA